MAAGQQYAKNLNTDQSFVKTTAIYDSSLDEWLILSANVVKTEGGVFIYQKGTDDGKAKVSAELIGSTLTDSNALSVKIQQDRKVIANAVAFTDTSPKTYDLITHGLLTEEQIRRIKYFKISINNTHDQPATIAVYTAFRNISTTVAATGGKIYAETGIVAATSGRLILQSAAVGTGADATFKTIPALRGVHSNIIIVVSFAIAPTTGSITMGVEMNG